MKPLKFLKFLGLVAIARARGLFYRWPKRPDRLPKGTSAAHSDLALREAWKMYDQCGWVPWCTQRIPSPTARMFVVYDDDGNPD